jgi:hypothetical protein
VSTLRSLVALVLATCGTLAACGSSEEDSNSEPVDASADSALDAPGDSEPADSAPDTTSDTGADAAPDVDAAPADAPPDLDCSRIGCGPPPICGEACTGPCGCCYCGFGSQTTIDGGVYTCTGPCWAPVTDAASSD